MDKYRLENYINLTKFLGATLGPNYEIILHILEGNESHIASIVNNHISGRTTDSPLTGFALELMRNKAYYDNDYIANYKAKVKGHDAILGSTFYLKDEEGNLEGMLCINNDYSKYQQLSKDIMNLINSQAPVTSSGPGEIPQFHTEGQAEGEEEFVEILSNSMKDIIGEVIDPDILEGTLSLSQEAKIDIVEKLERKGIFQLKGAVSQVAEMLNVSEPSIYRYLKIVNKRNK
ncbi:helix-turn-helix transcriptional regulator [Vaginisenegalia massiliensis]|uniref:helix-turn-helix transcriptional regulator n=1 Tax=Vaginisenegalia massiliensis TaxID=2058294 RepID=UPI000F51C14A|nr:PAS domain-containing protein [Vaginisenegalia massiliensis]